MLILIAEDDEINRIVVRRQIEVLGHTADIARNGAEALQLWRVGDYPLLLTDLHMPELDGYALVEAIRCEETTRGPGGARMPILAITANALHGEAERAGSAGFDAYLIKPLRLDVLGAALRRWLPLDRHEAARARTGDAAIPAR